MPKTRWVCCSGVQVRLSELARVVGLAPQTLWGRLERGMPIARALTTGILTPQAAGRRGALRSPWRHPDAGGEG